MNQPPEHEDERVIRRTIATASLVSSSISTSYYTTLVVFTVSTGLLSGALLGLFITIGAILAPITSMWVGRWCDRYGAKRLVALSYSAKAVALCMLISAPAIADSRIASLGFGVAVVVTAVTQHAVIVSQGAFIGVVLKGASRQRFSAQMRSLLNAGYLVGAIAGSLAVGAGIAWTFPIVGAASALVSLACGVAFLFLVPDSREIQTEFSQPLRDIRYFALAAFSGVLATADAVLTIGVPIILVSLGAQFGGIFPLLMAVNAILVVLFQVRIAGRVDSQSSAAASMRISAIASAIACIVLGFAVLVSGDTVMVLVLVISATLVFVISEMSNAGGTWWLRYNSRTSMAQGAYGATFSLGSASGSFLGPVIVGAVAATAFGYFAFAVLYVLCAVCSTLVINWGSDVTKVRVK